MTGKIIDQGWGKYVQTENGESYPISRYINPILLIVGQQVEFTIENEYPDCGAFCDGDETCIICYNRNVVARLKPLS